MSSVGRVCTVLVLIAIGWCWANWPVVRTAWRYREQLRAAGEAGAALQDLGVLK